MAHKLLTLAPEVRHRILDYAITRDELSVCDTSYSEKYHLKTGRNPDLDLWLVCRQLTEDLKAIGVPKPTLRVCKLWCAREFLTADGAGWEGRMKCFKRHFTATNLQSDFRSEYAFVRFLDGAAQGFFGFQTTYAIAGGFKDPAGVDVGFYPV